MKKNVLLILCGLCGGLIPSLLYIRHMDTKMLRVKRLCWYMQHFQRSNS